MWSPCWRHAPTHREQAGRLRRAETGFVDLPEVKRLIRIPGGDAAARTRLLAEGEVDFGDAIPKGSFESARGRNPRPHCLEQRGPVWGTADACVYILGLNNQVYPFDNPDVRWAINYAIDRYKVIETAFEGSTVPLVAPFSTFGGVTVYTDLIAEKAPEITAHGADKVAARTTKVGFTKDGEGFWPVTLRVVSVNSLTFVHHVDRHVRRCNWYTLCCEKCR